MVYTDPVNRLGDHFEMKQCRLPGGAVLFTKPGVRGYPGLAPGVEPLLQAADLRADVVLDGSGSAGAVALAAPAGSAVRVLEPSRAAALCAARSLAGSSATVRRGAIWEAHEGEADLVAILPPADRGNARVEAELIGAFRALKPGGRVVFALHRDLGARRYQRWAAGLFELRELSKRSGWRVVEGRKRPLPEPAAVGWQRFEVEGVPYAARPGVFAAGKVDPGSARLLAALADLDLAGGSVLDLGCGYGLLALVAVARGAKVVALDDDWPSVESTRRNASDQGIDLDILHSDLTSDLPAGARFDLVITNPPFHVGKQVRMELPQAFVAAAGAVLDPGSRLYLVANRALPYERFFRSWAALETVSEGGGFKVYRATR